jgi:hypothetical protein
VITTTLDRTSWSIAARSVRVRSANAVSLPPLARTLPLGGFHLILSPSGTPVSVGMVARAAVWGDLLPGDWLDEILEYVSVESVEPIVHAVRWAVVHEDQFCFSVRRRPGFAVRLVLAWLERTG